MNMTSARCCRRQSINSGILYALRTLAIPHLQGRILHLFMDLVLFVLHVATCTEFISGVCGGDGPYIVYIAQDPPDLHSIMILSRRENSLGGETCSLHQDETVHLLDCSIHKGQWLSDVESSVSGRIRDSDPHRPICVQIAHHSTSLECHRGKM